MLSGKYRHTVDAKGRVIIPVRFREDLGEQFMVTKGLDDCLSLYSMAEWEVLKAKLTDLPMAKSRQIQRFLFAYAFPVELDGQGRIVIPADLREYAGLQKDVVITGISTRAEIWDSERWTASELEASAETITDMMVELGF